VIRENIALSVNGLSGAVLGEVEMSSAFATALGSIDTDPTKAGDQFMNTTGAKIQTVIRGQQWKIITRNAADETKFGPSYFLTLDSQDGTLDLKAEGQTFELAAESFSIEIVGSMKIKVGGSSDPNADDAARLFGGFFLRITPQRFEIFVQAEAELPALGLNGRAVGLIILDADAASPGLPGLAMMLNLELTLGASAEGSDQASALDGIFELRGSVVVTMNTTLREQVFQIPRSFLDLLPDDAPTTVTVYAAAPEINGSKRVDADPEIYISANIQGSITLFDTITLSGFISFTAATDLSGPTPSCASPVRSAPTSSTSARCLAAWICCSSRTRTATAPASSAGCSWPWRTPAGIPGVSISGQFLLEVNSYATTQTIVSFQTNKEANPNPTAEPQPNILATDPDTGLFVLGDIDIDPGLRLVLQGKLKIGDVVEITGRFEFILSTNPFAIEIRAQASMSLLKIGSFNIDGVFRVDGDGFAAFVDVSLGGGFGGDIGLSFDAGATLEIYIGSLNSRRC
jgi:hypothetical protein